MTKKNTIIVLFVLFILPVLASYWVYFSQYGNDSTTNNGELIYPPLDFNQLVLYDDHLNPLNREILQEHWLLLYILPNVCDEDCEYVLYQLGQIHKALGKEQPRVQRVIVELLLEQQRPRDLTPHLPINDYLGSIHSTVEMDDFRRFIAGQASAAAALDEGAIYVVDPLGNLMMYYPLNTPAKGILKDLERLLKVSKIG